MQNRWTQVTLGGCKLPVREKDTAKTKKGDRKQQMRKAQQSHRERRQVPSASFKEPHLTYQQFPHTQNTAALRPCLTQIPSK